MKPHDLIEHQRRVLEAHAIYATCKREKLDHDRIGRGIDRRLESARAELEALASHEPEGEVLR
jgi:hypothetical protein